MTLTMSTETINHSETTQLVGVDLDAVYLGNRHRVLIIEDDSDMVNLLKQILRLANFDVVSARSGKLALSMLGDVQPDVILLDLMMPEMDGWETYQFIREISDVPVIVVSAVNNKENIVKMLDDGVDDYVSKPFHRGEVVSRVNAVLRRAFRSSKPKVFIFPDIHLSIDPERKEVNFQGQPVKLTPKEFEILEVLAKFSPGVVPHQSIAVEVWGQETDDSRKRIKYLIYLIRQKFEEILPGTDIIETVDRIGYKLRTSI
jgi:DNA-binding response OmpR family regulator